MTLHSVAFDLNGKASICGLVDFQLELKRAANEKPSRLKSTTRLLRGLTKTLAHFAEKHIYVETLAYATDLGKLGGRIPWYVFTKAHRVAYS